MPLNVCCYYNHLNLFNSGTHALITFMENVGGRYGGNACKEGKKMKLKKQEKAEYAGLYITFQHRRRKEGTKGRHLILYSHQAEIML